MTRPSVMIATTSVRPSALVRLEALFDTSAPPATPQTNAATLAEADRLQPAAILMTNQNHLDAAAIDALPGSVRIIATISVGTDHIDIAAATRRGIIVTNTPGVLDDCTADLTWLLVLGAARRATESIAYIQRNHAHCPLLGTRVSGRTLGIWGMGRIGRKIARRAQGFDMNVLYHNRRRLDPELEAGATFIADRDEFLARSTFLSLMMPATAQNVGLVGKEVFDLLPRGAIFINSARGSLVDEEALFAALASGQLAAAGLDVFRNEPNIDPRFATTPQIFALPHIGSATNETRDAMAALAVDNIEAVLAGRPALTPAT